VRLFNRLFNFFRDPLPLPLPPELIVTLLQTRYATGNRVYLLSHATQTAANTPAGTHDGNDATEDAATLVPVGGTSILSYSFDPTAPAVSIAFVRIRARAKGSEPTGPGLMVLQAKLGFSTIGVGSFGLTTSFADYSADFTVNPFTGNPWQPEEIDAVEWQVQQRMNSSFGPSTEGHCSEFFIEVWGDNRPISLGGYTSYDLGLATLGSPEAERLPEESARAWVGDRRYQEV
jgi:hypothetical protein